MNRIFAIIFHSGITRLWLRFLLSLCFPPNNAKLLFVFLFVCLFFPDSMDILKCQEWEGRYFHYLLSLRYLLKTLMLFQISCCFYLTITYKTITNNKSFLGGPILQTKAILHSQGQFSFLIYPRQQNCRCWSYFTCEKKKKITRDLKD